MAVRKILFISSSELLTGEANFTMLPQNWKELCHAKEAEHEPEEEK